MTESKHVSESQTLKEALQKRRPSINTTLGDNALMATFQVAVSEFITGGYFLGNDEETTTGALLGAIAACAPLCFEAYGQDPDFNWVRYPKSGHGSTTEPSTGADFALILRVSETKIRLAVFQAKRTDKRGTYSVHQISPERSDSAKPPEPQFIRLKDYARDLLTGIRNKKKEANQLAWVHYLSYEPKSIYTVPLSKLTDISEHYDKFSAAAEDHYYQNFWKLYPATPPACDGEAKEQPESLKEFNPKRGTSSEKMRFARALWKDLKPQDIESNTSGRIHFLSLLMIGASTEIGEATGWLELDGTEAAKDLVGRVSKHLDIYVGRVKSHLKMDLTLGSYLDETMEQRHQLKEEMDREIFQAMHQDLSTYIPGNESEPSNTPGM